MILLTTEEIICLHEKMILATGGTRGIRDKGILESAIYGALATYDNNAAYETLHEKAARLSFSIIKNHPFIDGNKRIGVFVMLMTLRLNYIAISYSQQELVKLGLAIAEGSMDYESILSWINNHLII